MKAELILDQAITNLRVRGWAQRNFLDCMGRVCMAGAVIGPERLEGNWIVTPDMACALEYVQRVVAERFGSDNVTYVNDNLVTSAEEAAGILEKARALAAEEGA